MDCVVIGLGTVESWVALTLVGSKRPAASNISLQGMRCALQILTQDLVETTQKCVQTPRCRCLFIEQ